ncbi:MAG TPA: MFS transporter [Candidatus Paceibacterota bacterium]|nr:MFS transporter [Candidatus Paceibacterota bacterium]HPT40411.1 MFS transporter [Candidatus Paceibacterota bacterium]
MRINKVIKVLITADFFMLSAVGMASPIFAVFITDHIQGGNLALVGYVSTVYLLVKAFFQLIFGTWIDKKDNEKYDFYLMIVGSIIASLAPLGYMFSTLPWHVYLIEGLNGLGFAMNLPAWYAIFTRHIDRGQEGFQWSLETMLVALGSAITASAGGYLAERYGFNLIFILMSAFSLLGTMFMAFIYRDLKAHKFIVTPKTTDEYIKPFKKRLMHKRYF